MIAGLKHISQATNEASSYIEGRASGEIKSLKTSFKSMNKATLDGFEWGDVVTIGGMSSSGKTLILGELEDSLTELNKQDFAIISNNFEMMAKRLMIRRASSEFGISYRDLLSAETPLPPDIIRDIKRYFKEDLSNRNIYYPDRPLTLFEYEQTIRTAYAILKKPLVITNDHTILFKKVTESDNTKLVYALCELQNVIKRDIPCIQINLTQLNREIENEDRRRPGTVGNYPVRSDIMASDALFHVSDLVLVNHRPSLLYLRHYGPDKTQVTPSDIFWHFLKVRNGEPFVKRMKEDFRNMRIIENE
jgi:replicative DNA helicase